MPKKVKTKKQKMLADLRRNNYSPGIEKTDFTTYSLPTIKMEERISTPPERAYRAPKGVVTTAGYTYLLADLRKTILLTCTVVIVEILIKYYFKI